MVRFSGDYQPTPGLKRKAESTMRIGVRAHDFGALSPETLAATLHQHDFDCAQLALGKSFPDLVPANGRLNPGLCYRIRRAFEKQDVQIAVLGCYVEPAHPDENERKNGVEKFLEHVRYANQLGAACVATETTLLSMNAGNEKKAREWVYQNVSRMVEEAEKFGVLVAIEPVQLCTIQNAEQARKLIDDIGSNNLQIILDAVNLLEPENHEKQDDIVREFFDLLGDRILAMHAKDYVVENGKKRLVAQGEGILNHDLLYSLASAQRPEMNVLIEGIDTNRIAHYREFLRKF